MLKSFFSISSSLENNIVSDGDTWKFGQVPFSKWVVYEYRHLRSWIQEKDLIYGRFTRVLNAFYNLCNVMLKASLRRLTAVMNH
jgi:hypothetical protein